MGQSGICKITPGFNRRLCSADDSWTNPLYSPRLSNQPGTEDADDCAVSKSADGKFADQTEYTDVMDYFTGLVGFLIRKRELANHDPEVMAAQLCLPISVWINLCEREPEQEEEIMQLVKRNIEQFFQLYKPQK